MPVPRRRCPRPRGHRTPPRAPVQVLGVDVEAVDVVEGAVVRLADDRERPDVVSHPVGPRGRLDQGVPHDPDAVGVRDADRPAEHPRLADPLEAGQLAIAVEPMRPGEDRLGPDVAVVRHDRGHPGPHRARAWPQRAVARDQGRVPDPDAGHVGDAIEGSRLHATDANAKLARAHRAESTVQPIGPSWTACGQVAIGLRKSGITRLAPCRRQSAYSSRPEGASDIGSQASVMGSGSGTGGFGRRNRTGWWLRSSAPGECSFGTFRAPKYPDPALLHRRDHRRATLSSFGFLPHRPCAAA